MIQSSGHDKGRARPLSLARTATLLLVFGRQAKTPQKACLSAPPQNLAKGGKMASKAKVCCCLAMLASVY